MSEPVTETWDKQSHLSGFRLNCVEVFNWGTFHNQIWRLTLDGQNALLTGDIGSGKSTLVDAITTLMVPANRIAYNKAAGADFKERTLRSYVQGYYRSERDDDSHRAKPVALRDHNSYSVILGVFYHEGFDQWVTLAQVFWHKDASGQPARFFVVADEALDIATHFSRFGNDINQLKKRLRRLPAIESLFDTYPPYAAAFKRRFGITNEQALELFHQTVSMKSVDNLTQFVRSHMLEAFDIEPRIDSLIEHFDDLTRAHNAVLKAKRQVMLLTPLAEDIDRHEKIQTETETSRQCRDGLRYYFATLKSDLLKIRLEKLATAEHKLIAAINRLTEQRTQTFAERDHLTREIAANGGDRLERLRLEIAQQTHEQSKRKKRYENYQTLANELELNTPESIDDFLSNRQRLNQQLAGVDQRETDKQNELTECSVAFQALNEQHKALNDEIESLKQRKNNIDARQVALRQSMCQALGIDESDMPFVGELLQVHESEKAWEGAIERLLHNFGLSLLVPDRYYARVSDWVEKTHLKGRIVYYRVTPVQTHTSAYAQRQANSLISKLDIKPETEFYEWIEHMLSKRFDYACCETLAEFRKASPAITKSGQIKTGGQRHEKDDRRALSDRSFYILGWSNQAKLKTLTQQQALLQQQIQTKAQTISERQNALKQLAAFKTKVIQLESFKDFEDINWRDLVRVIADLQAEKEQLESSSNILKSLTDALQTLQNNLQTLESKLDEQKDVRSKNQARQQSAQELLQQCGEVEQPRVDLTLLFNQLDQLRQEVLGDDPLTVESCENKQQKVRESLQSKIDAQDKRLNHVVEKIIKAMEGFRHEYPAETQELDANLQSGSEFKAILAQLNADDLPRFEQRFKALLNENTIREIANFQSQLNRERQDIFERIERINHSLAQIEYNPGRFIRLEAQENPDAEVRQFRSDLRHCTEGTLSGNQEDTYAEEKFLQVKAIIERLKGREGQSEMDKRWRRKVTDVRNWFVFAASERWIEDGSEFEHYTDSGGKSGGQKEKLAYTVLAASLAYQFGLEWGQSHSRSFRFVVIDEAFGRGSDDSAQFGLNLFKKLDLQLLIVTPLQKIHIIEPFVSSVGFVHSHQNNQSLLRNLTIKEYQHERDIHLAT